MPTAIAFWIVMFLWVVFSLVHWRSPETVAPYYGASVIFPFLALCLAGYALFGAALK